MKKKICFTFENPLLKVFSFSKWIKNAGAMNVKVLLPILFAIACTLNTGAQSTNITGKITDALTGEPLPGVNVVIKGTSTGTVSDTEGKYSMMASYGQTLVLSFIGYVTEEIEVGTQNTIDVSLVADLAKLDEVVVIGYGTVKKSDLTGSVVSIKDEDLTAIPVTNALEVLQGKVAGMDMTKSSGEAGSGLNFTIRGNRSISASNSPLIIVDGIPYGSDLDISPQEIESIEVLKDASSTAIYGSRGANGVILVTTKRGNANKPMLNFNMYAGPNTIAGYPDFTNAQQWIAMRREAWRANGSWDSEDDDPAIFGAFYPLIQNENFMDWQREVVQQGFLQNYQLGLSGGNEKTVYSISANYNKEEGILRNDIYNRYTIRSTIDHTFNDWIKLGSSMHYSITDRDRRGNPFNQANKQPPLGIPYDEEGKINVFPWGEGNDIYSPLADEIPGVYTNNNYNKKLLSNSFVEFRFFNFMTFRSTLGLTFSDNRTGYFGDRESLSRSGQTSKAEVTNSSNNTWQWENFITMEKEYGIQNIQLVAGSSATKEKKEWFKAAGQDIFSPNMKFYNLQATDKTLVDINSNYEQQQLLSFFARLNYTLNNKYLLTLVARADGASVLAPGNQWQSFPSAAIAWKIHEEDFLKTQNILSLLKFRASYGLSGNSSVDPYDTDSRLGLTMYSWEDTPAQGYYLRTMAAEGLGWETTSTVNLGLDAGILGNRITATVDLYWQHTYDLLLERKLPTSLGYYSVTDNVGETKNEGIEISIGSDNLSRSSGLSWTTDVTFAHNKEEIVALADSTVADIDNGWFVGYPIHVHYDYKKIGIWQLNEEEEANALGFEPGDIKVLDYDPNDTINDQDRFIIGDPRPKFTLGLNNRFEHKGIDLSFFIFARVGQMINSELHSRFDETALGVSIVADYWTPENPTNAYPRPNRTAPNRAFIPTLGYVDGSFVKIRDVTLGYSLPQSITNKAKITGIRFYATMKNYFTFSNVSPYDPERGGSASFPMTKQLIFGANLTF